MIEDYREARAVVAAEFELEWDDVSGTFHVAEEGFEDAEAYMVPWGAREWLVDEDPAFVLINGAVTFVEKATGFVVVDAMVANLDRVDRMTLVR